VTATNSKGSDTRESSVAVFQPLGAPVADPGPHYWNENEATGFRTFDAAARFSVPGDPTKASVAYGLMAGGGVGGPFLEGVLEDGVFVGQADGYVSIDPALGVLSIDTDVSGPLAGVTVTVRASNTAGTGDLTITLTVAGAEAWSPAELFAVAGSAGVYLDARDDAMFQEHAGTSGLTPADAHLEPIGTVAMTTGSLTPPVYARAGNGTTGRPTRWESGGDVAIEYADTSAQSLSSVALGAFRTGWHIFVAARRAASSGTTSKFPLTLLTPGLNNFLAIGYRHDTNTPRIISQCANHSTPRAIVHTSATTGTMPAVGTDYVMGGFLGINAQKLWLNGTQVVSADSGFDGTESLAGAIMQLGTNPFGQPRPGRVYRALAYRLASGAEMDAELRARIFAYLTDQLPS
jgi:hypothetical protein